MRYKHGLYQRGTMNHEWPSSVIRNIAEKKMHKAVPLYKLQLTRPFYGAGRTLQRYTVLKEAVYQHRPLFKLVCVNQIGLAICNMFEQGETVWLSDFFITPHHHVTTVVVLTTLRLEAIKSFVRIVSTGIACG